MPNIDAKKLKLKFIEVLNQLEGFSYEEGSPFLIRVGNDKYFLYLKNISSAYFKKSPDITRVQLPTSQHFKKIAKSDVSFIILGYDVDNDTVACWNPAKVKSRLNDKRNVSLYSRESLQSQVRANEFKSGYLSNGEKIILFKREHLPLFFENLPNLFDEFVNDNSSDETKISDSDEDINSNKLSEIPDKIVIEQIQPMLKNNRVLEAVETCSNYYGDKYKSMQFKDWFKIVDVLYKESNV